ncbi:MAG: hypothetical protein FWH34_07885 [Desulfovibrionaceae bacterium]|nr:hypothetical protein [Desulfovibrionaceae bacterium]
MLVTENAARFLFCPLLKTHDDKMKCCQVAKCMLWRYADSPIADGTDGAENRHGYCGLAGRPLGDAPGKQDAS